MKNQILKIFIIGYVICLTFCASQIQENTEFNEYSMIEAEKYFESNLRSGDLIGVQYEVFRSDGSIFRYAGGVDNFSENTKVSENTKFFNYSSTKFLTAIAILKLVDTNKLDIDSSLNELGVIHPYGNQITVINLLNQSSGIPNPLPLKWLHTEEEHSAYNEEAFMKGIMDQNSKLDFEPGKKYAYSNISYYLLGKVVEVVSGMSYNKYIEEEIFHPLDISSEEFSFNYDSSPTATGYISKYSFLNSIFYLLSKSSYYGDSSNGYSSFQKLYNASYSIGGSLANTKGWRKILSDLLKDNSILLSDKTKLALFTQQKDSIGNPIETSLGLHTGSNQGEIYYGKPGGGAGFFSNIRIYPHIGIATVILSNTTKVSSVDIYKISDQVDKSFLKTRK